MHWQLHVLPELVVRVTVILSLLKCFVFFLEASHIPCAVSLYVLEADHIPCAVVSLYIWKLLIYAVLYHFIF